MLSVISIAGRYRVHPNPVCAWKKALVEAAPKVFSDHLGRTDTTFLAFKAIAKCPPLSLSYD